MLWVNWPVVGMIYSQSNRFVMGVKVKATGDLKLNDRPAEPLFLHVPDSNHSVRTQA